MAITAKKSPTNLAGRGLMKKGGSTKKKYATGGVTKNQTGYAANRGLAKKGGSMKPLKKADSGMTVKSAKPAMDTASAVKAPVVAKAKKPMTSGGLPLYDNKGNIIYQKKKGGSAKAMPKAMYGKSMMKKGGAKKK